MFAYTKIMQAMSGAVAVVTDAYFNLVTLLLNTSSTNGAQNNTFLDSSTNNFTITRNGNTTQGTFTPFSQTGWSNYFGATGTYLTVTSQPLINVNDWTVEFWMYPTQFNNNGGIFGASNGGGTNPKLYLYVTGSNLIIEGYSGGFFTALSTAQPTLNQWTYLSVSRSSSTGNAYIYYNGVLQGSAAAVPAITGITGGFSLLSNGEGSSAGFYGYMSNMRVSNVARYTGSSYSVPTAPSTAIANTTLLTAQSNRYVDNSSNGYAIAVTGTPSVQAFSPFLPTAAYSTSVVGGSGYFDGSGDYLNTSGANLAVGTGDFTYQFWMYALASNPALFDTRTVNNTTTGFTLLLNSSNFLSIYTNGTILTASTAATLNAWQFVSIVRSSGTLTIYLNGVSVGSTSFTNDLTDSTIVIGRYVVDSGLYLGYISGFQLLKGTAASGAIPTAPPTNITNTQLLLNYTNAGIFDSTAKNDLETVGNAQVSTTQAKWGTTSMAFDGTGDYLQVQSNSAPANFNMGTGDYTVEFWMYSGTPGSQQCLFDFRNADVAGQGIAINYRTDRTIAVYMQADRITSSAISANTWTHIAVVRASGTYSLYINGVSAGTWANSDVVAPPANRPIIGAVNNGTQEYNGYLDDLRITKGYARYTSNFTPPTAAFPVQ